MLSDGKIFVGKSTKPEYLDLRLANRHGLITGATGTGKTVSLQVLAEGFSDALSVLNHLFLRSRAPSCAKAADSNDDGVTVTLIVSQVGELFAVFDKHASKRMQALRALRSTLGITTVLVGMRQESYVDDVLEELGRPVSTKDRTESWRKLLKIQL